MVVDAYVIKSVAPGNVLLHAGAKLPTGVAFERRRILDAWVTDPGLKFTDFNAALDKVRLALFLCFLAKLGRAPSSCFWSDPISQSRLVAGVTESIAGSPSEGLKIGRVSR
jgi:hypothetical protein